MNGKSAPTIRATTVINSAMRVTDSCQRALETRKMAESNVPAWLIPIKKTKLAMYSPQEIRSRMPVTMSPLRNWWM